MVLLGIELPPASDDVGSGSRDSRDVVDENIFKAQTIYQILATTAPKKSLLAPGRGPCFGFEIIAQAGLVSFYAVADIESVGILKQAINSAYPTAKVELVPEYNFFDPKIEIATVVGGHLSLKNHFSQPIASYLDTKQDAIRSLLNALAQLQATDGAGWQLLLRPAPANWIKQAQAQARKQKNAASGNLVGQFLMATWRPPETTNSESGELTGPTKDLIGAIENKANHPGFEVMIRLVVATTNRSRSQAIYNNLVASFGLFEAPGKNGFVVHQSTKVAKLIDDFNLRSLDRNSDLILNSVELASLFHLPDRSNLPTSQVERQATKQVDGPRRMLDQGLILGNNIFRDQKRPVILGDEDRLRHIYVIGQTGTGKSVFLENIILQDIQAGRGFAVVDPHSDLADRVLAQIPPDRQDDVLYFSPADMDYPLGLNIFETQTADDQDFLIQEAIQILYKLYDPQQQGIIGPRFEHIFRNSAKLIMANPAGGSFIEIPKLLTDRDFVLDRLKHCTDPTIRDFWLKEMPASERSPDFGDVKSWVISKFSAFLGNAMMRNILGQIESSFDLSQIMNNRQILIVNLNKGLIGEINAKLLGMILVTKFQMAAISRAKMAPEDRVDFSLYVDEFQNFVTESFASILSEARKYRLSLVVATQHTDQLTDDIKAAIFGNVGTAVAFRIGVSDAEMMTKQFLGPVFEIEDLTSLPIGQAGCRLLIDGSPSQPFSLATLPPNQITQPENVQKFKARLVQQTGRPRQEVEQEIFKRLNVKTALPKSPPPFNISADVLKTLRQGLKNPSDKTDPKK